MDVKSKTSSEVDIQDLYDSLLVSEETFVASGYAEGLARGEEIGFQEGYNLGLKKGTEIGAEIAFYKGFAKGWVNLLSSSNFCDKIVEQVDNCASLDPIVSTELKNLYLSNNSPNIQNLQSEIDAKTLRYVLYNYMFALGTTDI